jgi:hypothetical protein
MIYKHYASNREGNRRSAYSHRLTYICLRLLEGVDIYQIAKNCRASVEMIENHCAVHLKNTLDAKAINVRRKELETTSFKVAVSFPLRKRCFLRTLTKRGGPF